MILVDIDEDGHVIQIFPNKFSQSAGIDEIVAGQKMIVPEKRYGFDAFRADLPKEKLFQRRVRGKLIALVVPKKFDFARMVGFAERQTRGFVPEKIPTSYLMNLINQISSMWKQRGVRSVSDDWAYGVMDYEITAK